MSKSIPYTASGRTRQKARTEAAMIAAARELLAEGITPTVEQAAERAGVSRATAYRYFVNQQLLLAAAHPETEASTLLPPDPPDDPVERVQLVAGELMRIIIDTEPELRAMLRFSLDPARAEQDLLLRKGRRIMWFEDALSPLRPALGPRRHRDLVLAVAAAVGIESFVWLTDIAAISRRDAAKLMIDTARSLTEAAIARS
jgi:AcrR family transcriptional regulator